MTEPEDLCGRTFRWEVVGGFPLDVRILEAGLPVGGIYSPSGLKPMVAAEIAGSAFRIGWTDQSFYRISAADSGLAVGEARYLPWRPDTFQARLGAVRAYRLHRVSPDFSAWQIGDADLVRFDRKDEQATVAEKMEACDAPPLLALGVLMAVEGLLFDPVSLKRTRGG